MLALAYERIVVLRKEPLIKRVSFYETVDGCNSYIDVAASSWIRQLFWSRFWRDPTQRRSGQYIFFWNIGSIKSLQPDEHVIFSICGSLVLSRRKKGTLRLKFKAFQVCMDSSVLTLQRKKKQ